MIINGCVPPSSDRGYKLDPRFASLVNPYPYDTPYYKTRTIIDVQYYANEITVRPCTADIKLPVSYKNGGSTGNTSVVHASVVHDTAKPLHIVKQNA